MVPGLAALIHPHPLDELARHYRDGEPFAIHALTIAELRTIPMLESLEVLLDSWPDQVGAHPPDVADEAAEVIVSPREARELFGDGCALRFDELQRFVPLLDGWLDALRVDLGLSALTHRRCLVYATPAGRGNAPHFDQNVNFVLQLSGTKTWSLAPNTHVARPMTRHTIGQPVDGELQSYARLPMPEELPATRTEIVLEPGSLLFVPRGTWHATHAATDAVSLNFTFSPPTWIDVLTAALRSRLALSSDWRETAAPLDVATFDALLRELAAGAADWRAADILAATEG